MVPGGVQALGVLFYLLNWHSPEHTRPLFVVAATTRSRRKLTREVPALKIRLLSEGVSRKNAAYHCLTAINSSVITLLDT